MEQLVIPGALPDYRAHGGHYHIGANMIGYLPESDVFCADNIEDAVQFFLSKLQEARDEAEDMYASPFDQDDHMQEWRQLADEIERMQESGEENSKELQAKVLENHGYSYTFCPPEGADIRYWIEPQSYDKFDAMRGKFSRADICEIMMDQNDIPLPYYKSEAQTASHCYWGAGHYFIYADKTVIGMTSKDDMGYWWAYRDYLPPTPDKERQCVGKSLLTRELAVRALWVAYKENKEK